MEKVIDANVLMRGRNFPEAEKLFTVPAVLEELESDKSKLKFDTASIKVRQPSEQSLEKVTEKSEKVQAATSEADEELVALGLDLDATVVSDDKDLQNLCLHLGVDFEAFMGDEVEQKLSWKKVCGNCGEEVEGENCSNCGSTSTRRRLDQCSSG